MLVATVRVQRLPGRPVRLGVAVDRISIESPSDRLVDAGDRLQMDRGDVVVVVVGEPAVTAVEVEFADLVGEATAVVARVENRDAVDADGDGAALEVALRDRDGIGGRGGDKRQAPDVGAAVADRARVLLRVGGEGKVGRGQGNLLLPRRDADHGCWHQGRTGHIVGLHVEGRGVIVEPHARSKGPERSSHHRAVAGGLGGRGARLAEGARQSLDPPFRQHGVGDCSHGAVGRRAHAAEAGRRDHVGSAVHALVGSGQR